MLNGGGIRLAARMANKKLPRLQESFEIGLYWRRGESNPYFHDATVACSRYTTPPSRG